jgi:hypothetical protein
VDAQFVGWQMQCKDGSARTGYITEQLAAALLASTDCLRRDVPEISTGALDAPVRGSSLAPSARDDAHMSRGEEPPDAAPRRRTQGTSAMWSVVSGSAYCEVTQGGTCVTDGAGDYGSNEVCTVRAEVTMLVSAQGFITESGFDFVFIGGAQYSGGGRPGECLHERGGDAALGE